MVTHVRMDVKKTQKALEPKISPLAAKAVLVKTRRLILIMTGCCFTSTKVLFVVDGSFGNAVVSHLFDSPAAAGINSVRVFEGAETLTGSVVF